MANKIKQFRFYSNRSAKNQPSAATSSSFISGDVFNGYYPVLQLGIQALPGTMFYVNQAADPVIIGKTGIYELDLDGDTQISQLQFDASSITTISENNSAYLIVDILYEGGN